MEQGACLGIPGITAHRAVHVAGAPSEGERYWCKAELERLGLAPFNSRIGQEHA
jgi:hypothetical protein